MNGADSLMRTLVQNGVEVCFANPGTSEVHLVAAMDGAGGMRAVPCPFEGVASGAADGYYRIAGRPAATLLHLGPGLGNALANLHNAKKARSGVINLVGQHAHRHLAHDAPLTANIPAIAAPMSHWVHSVADARSAAADAARAIAAARGPPGQVATLIVPADTAWDPGGDPVAAAVPLQPPAIADSAIRESAAQLRRADKSILLLGGAALAERPLELAGRIAARTGCRLRCENQNARIPRGAGRVKIDRLPYAVDRALDALEDIDGLVLAGAAVPVGFFAYPERPSRLIPETCEAVVLAAPDDDIEDALQRLAAELDALDTPPAGVAPSQRPTLPRGAVDPDRIAAVLGALLPEDAIVVDESISVGRGFFPLTAGAPPHDWLNIAGGSIGFALPAAVGAAIAAPGRKLVVLEGDGSGLYTPQALWTMARESLDVTILVFANRGYRILHGEMATLGLPADGAAATRLFQLENPTVDWQGLARSLGVEAMRADDCESLARGLRAGLASEGPYLVELLL